MPLTISKEIVVGGKPRIGRNDPCYCGSGKKYKKCHLNQDKPYIPQKGDVGKLVDWLSKHESFQKEVKRLGEEIYGEDHIFDEADLQAITETTIYEGLIEGKTPFEFFLEESQLFREEFNKYSSWNQNNVFSIFEVKAVDLGNSLRVLDLYTNKEYLVYERLGTYSAEAGMILAARILPLEEDWIFSGGILLPLPKEMGYSLKRVGGNLTGSLSQIALLKAVFGQKESKQEISESNLEEIDPKQKPGSVEQMLVREMMFEAQSLPINKQRSEKTANRVFSEFAQNWLKTPQPQLEGRTPTDVILTERKGLGNPNKKLTYKFNITKIKRGNDSSYMEAVNLMQNKHRYLDALKLFASIEEPFENLEESFRFLCNVGVCLIYLGQMELGKKYFLKSLEMSPEYQTSQNNLKNYDDSEIIDGMRSLGRQRLFIEAVDRTIMFEDELIKSLPFSGDSLNFLSHIADNSLRITKVRHEITLKDILSVNSLFAEPDPQHLEINNGKKSVIWDHKRGVQFPKVNFLHNIFLAGGLIKEENNRLKITKRGRDFFGLSPGKQFGTIFNCFFSKLDWHALNGFDNLRGQFLSEPVKILQEISYIVLKSIQDFHKPFSANMLMKKALLKDRSDNFGTMMLSMLADKLLLNHLVWMGMLQVHSKGVKKLQQIPAFSSDQFGLTPFGNRVISQIDQTIEQSIPQVFYRLI